MGVHDTTLLYLSWRSSAHHAARCCSQTIMRMRLQRPRHIQRPASHAQLKMLRFHRYLWVPMSKHIHSNSRLCSDSNRCRVIQPLREEAMATNLWHGVSGSQWQSVAVNGYASCIAYPRRAIIQYPRRQGTMQHLLATSSPPYSSMAGAGRPGAPHDSDQDRAAAKLSGPLCRDRQSLEVPMQDEALA